MGARVVHLLNFVRKSHTFCLIRASSLITGGDRRLKEKQMPSGKYYCDYCEKEFQDTQVARKRHLQSKPHLRAKSLWYSSATSDVNTQVSNFVPRGLCNRFVTSNFCPFGDSCRYLHPNNNQGNTGFTNSNTQPLAGLPNQHIQGSSLNRDFVSGRQGTGWFDLPPSLRPPPEQGYPQLPSIDWG